LLSDLKIISVNRACINCTVILSKSSIDVCDVIGFAFSCIAYHGVQMCARIYSYFFRELSGENMLRYLLHMLKYYYTLKVEGAPLSFYLTSSGAATSVRLIVAPLLRPC